MKATLLEGKYNRAAYDRRYRSWSPMPRERRLAKRAFPFPQRCQYINEGKRCRRPGERHHALHVLTMGGGPFDIIWLCRRHHGWVHSGRIREEELLRYPRPSPSVLIELVEVDNNGSEK